MIFTSRLWYFPVRHTCGHYEARLMAEDPITFFHQAGSECSECSPQGRPVQTHYETMAAVWRACDEKNAERGAS